MGAIVLWECTNGGQAKAAAKINDPIIPIMIEAKENLAETAIEKDTCMTKAQGQHGMIYLISPSNGVKNVLVIVENVASGKPVPHNTNLGKVVKKGSGERY